MGGRGRGDPAVYAGAWLHQQYGYGIEFITNEQAVLFVRWRQAPLRWGA